MLPLRRLEIRRHARRGGPIDDSLGPEGVDQAHQLGRSLRVGYTHLYSSGAQRATQTLASIVAGMGRYVLNGVVIRPGLASAREKEWREAVQTADGSAIEAILAVNEPLVREESERIASELRAILNELPEGGYALAIGHTPLIECGIYGLTGRFYPPLSECDGFLVSELKGGRLDVEDLRPKPR